MRYLILALLISLLGGCQMRLKDSIVEYTQVENKEGQHPHFNDQGTLYWYTIDKYDEARKADKYILIDVGRKRCGSCKTFISKVLPKYKDRLKDKMVGLAVEADDIPDWLEALQKKYLPKADILPVVMIFSSKGVYIAGMYGNITPEQFEEVLKNMKL